MSIDIVNPTAPNCETKTNTRVDYLKNGIKYCAIFKGKLCKDSVVQKMVMERGIGKSAIRSITYQKRTWGNPQTP